MVSLNAVRPGSRVRVLRLEGRSDMCRRLREMGFHESSEIRCIQNSPACICMIHHTRVGLSTQLARQILVEPVVGRPE